MTERASAMGDEKAGVRLALVLRLLPPSESSHTIIRYFGFEVTITVLERDASEAQLHWHTFIEPV